MALALSLGELSPSDLGPSELSLGELGLTGCFAFAVYWTWALVFWILDSRATSCKIAPVRRPMSVVEFGKISSQVVVRQVPFLFAALLVHAVYPFTLYPFTLCSARSWWDTVRFLGFAYLVQRVSFYYLHRLFHTKFLYEHVHFVHHQHTRPSAVVTASAHPIENMVVNAGPVLLGIALGRPNTPGLLLFVAWAVSRACWDHSGYDFDFSWFSDGGHHDLHHVKPSVNFGPWWMDRVHGTEGGSTTRGVC